jgi:hypothetical protein
VAVLLLFPVIARLWADALPVAPRTGPALPPVVAGRSGQVHDLPEFLTMMPDQVSTIVAGGSEPKRRRLAGWRRPRSGSVASV